MRSVHVTCESRPFGCSAQDRARVHADIGAVSCFSHFPYNIIFKMRKEGEALCGATVFSAVVGWKVVSGPETSF